MCYRPFGRWEGRGEGGTPTGVHLRRWDREHAVAARVLAERERPAAAAQLQHDAAASAPALRPLQLIDQHRRAQRLRIGLLWPPAQKLEILGFRLASSNRF